MLIEYNGMEDTIRSRLVQYQSNLQNSLSEDIWHLDITKIGSSIDGIVLAPEVIGANVLSPDGYFIARAGVVPTIERNRQSLQFGHYQSPQLEYSGALIEHSFKLVADQADKEHLATVVLYSSPAIVFSGVSNTFAAIIVSAMIKSLALWCIFLLFGRCLLNAPLNRLSAAIDQFGVDSNDSVPSASGERVSGTELDTACEAFEKLRKRLDVTLDSLRDSNARLNSDNARLGRAIDQSPNGVVLITNGVLISYANSSFGEISKLDIGDYIHQPAFNMLSTLFGKAGEPLVDAIGSCDDWTGELACQGADNTRWMSIRLSHVTDAAGVCESSILFMDDVSTRKKNEQLIKTKKEELEAIVVNLKETQWQLVQSEKMASLGQLSAGVAHEINNPIAFVKSNLSTLRQYTEDLVRISVMAKALSKHVQSSSDTDHALQQARALDKEAENAALDEIFEDHEALLTDVYEGVIRVQDIVLDLKDFSRSDGSDFCLLDLNECIETALKLTGNQLKYKVDVLKDLQDIDQAHANRGQLTQVITNLLVNASQAMENGGKIELSTSQRGNMLILRVADNGAGIEPENLDKLFTPFFTTKPVGEGTGLGLSISHGIIKQHGGDITVDSVVNQGTVFEISLPVADINAALAA